MKPEQFIREFGVEKAREVVEGHSKAYMPELFKYWSEQLNGYVLAPKYASCLVLDLERLVESVDWVKSFGGIESCKQSLYMLHELTEDPQPIRDAVRDYESIYGEEGASHE
ncbi:hypothetical protein I5730_04920 [Acinetobacter nosocomialis]|uniref:hypothetical protein n=1 Tax=Acinetobacter nosocomialis TaxID=106654 RepID=UPI00190163A6|nr:hypothetical protein [Acinetobacter nosocomialis]MBJ9959886.1 hypothetical protein [Acinetobacter nosocomialis]HEM7454778.1 hypothetical protein [Acinetobacter nosocomialis]